VTGREARNWLESAEYDLGVAQDMLAAGRHVYVIFMCHLALEKALKAHVVAVTNAAPPKTHDLIYLVKATGLDMLPDHVEFLGKINNASVAPATPMIWGERSQSGRPQWPQSTRGRRRRWWNG
jgi:HEPN domain-containing protein